MREQEREIYYIHSASLAYDDRIVFMSGPSAARKGGRKEMYLSLAANKAEWMVQRLCISDLTLCQGNL